MSSTSSRRSRQEKEREKLIQDRLQVLLSSLLREDENKYCVDCDAKGPRWASWNLGLFLCIRCAGIHRNLGVHISKVKSVNLDSWTPSQVASMQAMGNSRARAVFEAHLPDDFRRPQTESSLETFIRAKYEKKKYIAKEWVPTKPPDFPEGWTQLIEAEKQKKDIKQIRLPSHTLPPPTRKSSSPQPTPRPATGAPSSAQDLLALSGSKGGNALVNTASHVDLLGIGEPTPQSSESFDAFASIAVEPQQKAAPTSSSELKQSEEDFFNSPVTPHTPAESSNSKKMSNDSIMALFGQSGVSSAGPAFGNGQNNFMQGFNAPQANGFGNGFNRAANQNGANPFMAPGSMSDLGTNQVMNQFNGLHLGGPSSNGLGGNIMIPPSAPTTTNKTADSLANMDMWNGF